MKHDVFISYSSKDVKTALALCHFLEENRIRCWMAPRDTPGGAEYGDVINEAIKNTKVFVLVYSDNSARSQWVKAETNLAFANGKVIIPFRIDDSNMPGSMKLYLNDKHWIDAFPNPEFHFKAVVASVKGILNDAVLPNAVDSFCSQLHKPNKWIRLLSIIASSVFGLLGGLTSCVLMLGLIVSKFSAMRVFGNASILSMLNPLATICLGLVMFLVGVVLAQEHPWYALKKLARKESWKGLMAFSIAREVIYGAFRLFIAWFFILFGGVWCCGVIILLCQKISIDGAINGMAIVSILLTGGVCGVSLGLPVFKTGWALLDRDYIKFRFTPRRLYKWICLILLPPMLWCGLFLAFPSLKNEWEVKKPAQTREDSITRGAIQMFKESRWDEGVQLSRTANRQDPDLQFYLGLCYERGCGVSNDYAEALHWYRLSADNGNACAQCNLGLMYEKGLGVAQDCKKASEWYLKSSESGNPNAKAFLGDLYEHGKGVDQDVQKAKRLYLESLIASDALNGVTNVNDLTSALESDQTFAGMALKRMLLSFPSISDCQANPDKGFDVLMKASQNIIQMLQKQGVLATQWDVPDFTTDTFRLLQPGDDLKAVVETCDPGSVIMLREGVYNLDKTIYIRKPIKILGSEADKTRLVGGRFDIGIKDFLLSNITFENGRNGYGIWCEKDSMGCVAACNFVDCGIKFAESSCGVLVGVNVSSAEWGVSIGKDAGVVYLGGSIERCSDHCIIAFDNATVWAFALNLSECGGDAIRLNGSGGRLFMAACKISDIKGKGIYLAENTSARFSDVGIVNCAEAAIYTRGECVHRQLKVEDCKEPIKIADCGCIVCAEEDFVVPDFYFGRFTKRNVVGNVD